MIAFMKDGTIAEFGTHEHLISGGNDYIQLISIDQAQKNAGERELKENDGKNNVITTDQDLTDTARDQRARTRSKIRVEAEVTNDTNKEEEEMINYSSWNVLLEYFKVSFFTKIY